MITADYVARLVAAAPPLSDEQRTRLAELLRPVRRTNRVTPQLNKDYNL